MERFMEHKNWQCAKCGSRQFEVDQFRATGGFLAKIFDVQNKRFLTVTCTNCTFTEIYRTSQSTIGNVFDFFTN
jgi:predicted nucleic-acid-binding Zn-ribbon protein